MASMEGNKPDTKAGEKARNDPCARSIKRMVDLSLIDESDDNSSDMESYEEEELLQVDLSEEALKKVEYWKANMKSYMSEMDKELKGTAVGKSLSATAAQKPPRNKSKSPGGDSIDMEDDEFQPVSVDKTLVKNMLQSYWAEGESAQPGPASALLHSLKLRPPKDRDELDSDDFEEDLLET